MLTSAFTNFFKVVKVIELHFSLQCTKNKLIVKGLKTFKIILQLIINWS